MSETKRTFTIQGSDLGFEGGRYKGVSPMAAGRKAAKQLFRMIENKDSKADWKKYARFAHFKVIKFIIRESTRGSAKDTFFYEATVTPLKTPRVIERNGVQITVTKQINVKACTESLSSMGRTPKSA